MSGYIHPVTPLPRDIIENTSTMSNLALISGMSTDTIGHNVNDLLQIWGNAPVRCKFGQQNEVERTMARAVMLTAQAYLFYNTRQQR